MPNSYTRRRKRDKVLKRLALESSWDLKGVTKELAVELLPGASERLLGEAVQLADPRRYPHIDAALPAHRHDLRRRFFRRRLMGDGATPAALEALARELAPSPDDPAPPRRVKLGYVPVTYAQAFQAFESRRRRHDGGSEEAPGAA